MTPHSAVPERVAMHSDMLVASMRTPRHGDWICPHCFGIWDRQRYERCRCLEWPRTLDTVVPISYALGLGQLHDALRDYKNGYNAEVRDLHTTRLAAVLWRFLANHLPCIAQGAGVERFDRLCVVPSRTVDADHERNNLRRIALTVGNGVGVPFERLLFPVPELADRPGHRYVGGRFVSSRPMAGEAILLVDDTWTTGANAIAAGEALKNAGAAAVGFVVIGRFISDRWKPEGGPDGTEVYRRLPPFDWTECVLSPFGS